MLAEAYRFDMAALGSRMGFPGGASGKEPTCQCRRPKRRGFDPWVGKIPWRRAWQPTPVFLPGESHGQRSLVGYKESDTTEASELTAHRDRSVSLSEEVRI